MSAVRRGSLYMAAIATSVALAGVSGTGGEAPGLSPAGAGPTGGAAVPFEAVVPVATAPEGTVEGRVRIDARPPRRIALRYRGSAAPQTVQPLSAVVFLRGSVPGASPARPMSGASMVQRDSTFIPGVLAVPVGTTIEFPNEDPIFHNVFSYSSAKRFDLGRYPRGESREVTFDRPGVVRIFCEVHDHMRAAVVVSEHAFHEVVDEQGRFHLGGIPAGRYTLVAWHADLGEVETAVEVRAGQGTTVELTLPGGP